MSHRDPDGDPTRPEARAAVQSGEAVPPDEHTRRVQAMKRKNEPREAATNLKVHDEPAPEEGRKEPSSTDLSERSRRERRRARDRRAERIAFALVIGMFLSIGAIGWVVFDLGADDPPRPPPKPEEVALVPEKQKPVERRTSSTLDETPDLPALRMMAADGLTIAAEGLPEVTAAVQTKEAAAFAAIETCRFAYGVWEFSPNKRFRFLTTCQPLEGQVLVGGYEVNGSRVSMSPLIDGPAQLVSEFEVEKPSRMITRVTIAGVELEVNQRITTLRGGMQGEAFRATYAPRNTLNPIGGRAKAPAADPLLEAIQQPGE